MIAKFKQGCGDTLIVERKSSLKANKRFLYEGHFEGYTKNYTFQIYEAKSGRVKNLEKPNLNGFFVGKHNTIKLSDETGKFEGGFILEQNGIEINNTFEALVSSLKDDLSLEVARVLFS